MSFRKNICQGKYHVMAQCSVLKALQALQAIGNTSDPLTLLVTQHPVSLCKCYQNARSETYRNVTIFSTVFPIEFMHAEHNIIKC